MLSSMGRTGSGLVRTEWRESGGLGFLAKKSLKPRLPKPGKENILWLEVEFCGKWYLALIYLVPSALIASKMAILSELRQGIVDLW